MCTVLLYFLNLVLQFFVHRYADTGSCDYIETLNSIGICKRRFMNFFEIISITDKCVTITLNDNNIWFCMNMIDMYEYIK